MRDHLCLLLIGVSVTACGAPMQTAPAVRVVATATPGVRYVVVHPSSEPNTYVGTDREGQSIAATSEYVLFCDGRPADGMVCRVVGEVGNTRFGIAPAAQPGKAVPNTVGVLDTVIEVSHVEKRVGSDAQGKPSPSATTTASAAPPPPPPPDPPKEAPKDAGKEKKK